MVQITSHRQNFSKRLIQANLGNRYLTDMLAWLCSRDGLGNIETAAIYTYQNQTLQLVSSHGCLNQALHYPSLNCHCLQSLQNLNSGSGSLHVDAESGLGERKCELQSKQLQTIYLPLRRAEDPIGLMALHSWSACWDASVLDEIASFFSLLIQQKQQAEPLIQNNVLLESISRIQQFFIQHRHHRRLFDEVLAELLALTQSEFGFVAQVLTDSEQQPYLKFYTMSDISWNDETRRLFEKHQRTGMVFRKLDSLFGRVLTSGQPLIANDPASDPRAGGLPPGHPPLQAFLGIPIYYNQRLIAMVGLANRPGGYEQHLLNWLQPLLNTCATLIEGYNTHEAAHHAGIQHQTIIETLGEGVIVVDSDKRLVVANAAADQILNGTLSQGLIPGLPIPSLLATLIDEDGNALDLRSSPLGQVLHSGISASSSVLGLRMPDRAILWLSVQARPLIRDGETKPHAAVISFYNITGDKEQVQLIKSNKANLRALINNTNDSIFSIDRDKNLWVFNQSFEQLFQQLFGLKVYSGMNLDEAPAPTGLIHYWHALFDEALAGKSFTRRVQADALLQNLEMILSASPIWRDGEIIGATVYAKNVTELMAKERQLFERNTEFRSVFESLPDLYFRIDAEGIIRSFHTGTQEDLYLPPEAFLNRRLTDVMPPEISQQHLYYTEQILRTQQPATYEYQLQIDSELRSFEARLIPFLNDQRALLVRNITARKQDERALIEAKESAESASQIKNLFMAKMSHELRTPLNAVIGLTRMALQKEISPEQSRLRDYLARVHANGRQLLDIISNILELAQIESEKRGQPRESVVLSKLFESTSEAFREQIQHKGLELQINIQAPHDQQTQITTDSQRLSQVVYHLLENAVRFTDTGTISLSFKSIDGPFHTIEISDTGPGIPLDKQTLIFEPFEQADNSFTRKFGGTGLGLTVSRALCKTLGYELMLTQSSPQGSTFAIRLPEASD